MNKDNHDENKGGNCQGVGQDLFGQEAAQSCFHLRQRPFYLFERQAHNYQIRFAPTRTTDYCP